MSCDRHVSSCNRPPSNDHRVLGKLGYEEFQRTVYHDHVGDVMFETEYKPITPLTECVDLNLFDMECPTCMISLFDFSREKFQSKFKIEAEFYNEYAKIRSELMKKVIQEFRRHRRIELQRGEQDTKRVIMFEHVMEIRYSERYHQGSGEDAVAWAAALSADLAAVFGRFDQVELVEGHQVKDEECSICLRGDSVDQGHYRGHVRLPCRHVFHGHCIAMWLKAKNSCPMCRSNVSVLPPS